jgi:aryl-alcohol dehydrogenase-like predicted oxidoreductase
MQKRQMGKTGVHVNPIGLGCMGLSEFYGERTPDEDGVKLLHAAIELGVDHFDTAEMYGIGVNESLLGKAFADRRDKVFIATKFGIKRDQKTGALQGLDGSPEAIRASCEGSLLRLQTDHIDLYYQHRMDKQVPIEDTMGALSDLVKEGKIRAIGLSECSGDTLRQACAAGTVSAVQSEYSLFSRDVEEDVIPTCREFDISLVAYSPLGRGMLGGTFTKENTLGDKDYRHMSPRFSKENYAANMALVDEVRAIGDDMNAHPAQVALAWVLAQGDNIHTIPGTSKLRNLQSNLGAGDLQLSEADMAQLAKLSGKVAGDRYADMSMVNR